MAENFTEYTINSEYKSLHDKLGKDINCASLASLSSELGNALTQLSGKLNSVVADLGAADTWDDAISAEVNGSTKSGLDVIINSCKNPGFDILAAIPSVAEPLVTDLKTYVEEVNNYNDKLYPAWKTTMANEPKSTDFKDDPKNEDGTTPSGWHPAGFYYKHAHEDWELNEKEPIENACRSALTKIKNLETTIEGNVNTLKDLLNPVGSEKSTAALANFKVDAPRPEGIPEDAERIENDNGTVTYKYKQGEKDYEVTYDSENRKVKQVETTTNAAGDQVKTTVEYKDGKQTGKTVETTHKDETTGNVTTTTKVYDKDDKLSKTVTKVEDKEKHTITTTTTNAEGKKQEETVETYSDDGKTLNGSVTTTYAENGKKEKVITTDYSTNDNGERVEKQVVTTYDPENPDKDGVHTETIENRYDAESGNLKYTGSTTYRADDTRESLSEVTYRADGTQERTWKYEYQDDGNKIKGCTSVIYKDDGKTPSVQLDYKYNEDGKDTSMIRTDYASDGKTPTRMEETKYGEDGKTPVSKDTTNYDSDGKIVTSTESVTYYEDGKTPKVTTSTTYREDGSRGEVVVTDTTNNTQTTTTLDEYGNITITKEGIISGNKTTTNEIDADTRLAALNRAMEDGQISEEERKGLGLGDEHASPEQLMAAASEAVQELNKPKESAPGTEETADLDIQIA